MVSADMGKYGGAGITQNSLKQKWVKAYVEGSKGIGLIDMVKIGRSNKKMKLPKIALSENG